MFESALRLNLEKNCISVNIFGMNIRNKQNYYQFLTFLTFLVLVFLSAGRFRLSSIFPASSILFLEVIFTLVPSSSLNISSCLSQAFMIFLSSFYSYDSTETKSLRSISSLRGMRGTVGKAYLIGRGV